MSLAKLLAHLFGELGLYRVDLGFPQDGSGRVLGCPDPLGKRSRSSLRVCVRTGCAFAHLL